MSARRGDASPPARWRLWAAFAGLFVSLALVWYLVRDPAASHEVAYSVAYGWIRDGKVRSLELSREVMEGRLAAPELVDGTSIQTFHSAVPAQDDTLMPLLHAHDVALHVHEEAGGAGRFLVSLLPWLLVIGGWWWWSARMRGSPLGGGLPQPLRHRARRFDGEATSATKFADVAGLGGAKRDLEEIVTYLKDPDRITALGAKVPRGVLLVGPPGTGKTLIARAVAGEADVPFFSITGSEFIELFVGVGAARVRELFADAKAAAPSIVFIDELDAVGRVRGAGIGGGHDEREQTLDQLLAEMDGFDRRDQVIVLAATNRPDVLDPALLRPGRFDRRVVIDLPALAARRDILAVHVRDKPLAPAVDLDEIAAMTPGFSGADLANLINEAALHALREHHAQIEAGDVSAAYDKIVLGDPRDARLDPDERQRVATHEAGHAVAAWASPNVEPPRRISILPRGMALGATEQAARDRHVTTRRELEARLAVLLAGHAAELLVLGEASTGAEHDLRSAMRLAEDMVAHYGMSDALGPVYYEHHERDVFLGHRIATDGGPSETTVHAIERAARDLITQARTAATAVLERHRATLDAL
ncbi:MAG TPA: ATP-dependent zinc metalloprotease FtsH, partial [Kofleriaceae bacterium]|nr:ATP-dependent zinc metalloprotease FtsH [Kofleriaceae bacterium]